MLQILLLAFIVGAFSVDPSRGQVPGNQTKDTANTEEKPQSCGHQSGCTVDLMDRVVCTGVNVTGVPLGCPANATSVTIINTNVTTIPDGAFLKYANVASILFASNTLRSIAKGAFRGLPNLENLVLIQNNEFPEISSTDEPFEGLHSLKQVLISHEKTLTMFPLYLFANAHGLEKFTAMNNKISDMGPKLNFSLKNLTEINLRSNQITVIPNGRDFMDMPSLQKLDIGFNPLRCDCNALWMLEAKAMNKSWVREWGSYPPTCTSPKWMKFKSIPRLYPQDLTCEPPSVTPVTPTNITHTIGTPLTLQATMVRGFPYSTWVFPDGRNRTTTDGGVSDEIDYSDHSMVTTLTIDKGFNMPGLVSFTLVATNVAGVSNVTFWVYTDPSVTLPTTPETTMKPTETTTKPSTTSTSTSPATAADVVGAATGGPPVCTATLLLMLLCARLVTG